MDLREQYKILKKGSSWFRLIEDLDEIKDSLVISYEAVKWMTTLISVWYRMPLYGFKYSARVA